MPADTKPEPKVYRDVRRISDAQTLKALAHPVRLSLLESLTLHGAMTATEVGERIGESATTCSFHLRQLAKYGFVEEAGGGKGRARPWQMKTIGMSFGDTQDDPETQIAAGVLGRLLRERQLERYWNWRQTRMSYPVAWQDAAMDSEYLLKVTAEELTAINTELLDLLHERYRERMTDPTKAPPGSVPVEVLLFSYPLETGEDA
ncbi:MAG TPA: helix-turn-helix domain-containing protein [Acidimicrobiales bacterium]|jgi:predicted ArsR family transcriptional regulator